MAIPRRVIRLLLCLLVTGCEQTVDYSPEGPCLMTSEAGMSEMLAVLHGQECSDAGLCPTLPCFISQCFYGRCLGVALPDGQPCLTEDAGTCEDSLCIAP